LLFPARMNNVKRGTLLLLTIFFTSSCTSVIRSLTAGPEQSCLVLTGSTTREIDGVTRIIGSVRNDCKRRFGNVTVALHLSRSDRTNLPDPVIAGYVRDLEPGETKDFETLPVGRNASYRLDKITGY
jgi:hypothetical protein